MDKKIGVYICTGCGIGGAIDSKALSEIATEEYKVAICKDHPFLCSPQGASLIRNDLEEAGFRYHRRCRLFSSGDDRCF